LVKKILFTFAGILLSPLAQASDCTITPDQLQAEAIALWKADDPSRAFVPGKTSDVIVMGDTELGLQNLLAKLCLAQPSLTDDQRKDEIRQHLRAIKVLLEQQRASLPTSWEEVRPLAKLQFMPSEYVERFGKGVLVTQPFVPGIELAVVIDRPNAYGYVREEDRAKWGVPVDALYSQALSNLDPHEGSVRLESGDGPDRYLALEQKDGFDAVHIMAPWIRTEAAKVLGDPFFVGIPNRDFLMMWSAKNGAEFQAFVRKQTRKDFESQPYPLLPRPLLVWADGRVQEAD
jgi:hypothetical protein